MWLTLFGQGKPKVCLTPTEDEEEAVMQCRGCGFMQLDPDDKFPNVAQLLVAPDRCQELYESVYFCPLCGTLRINVPEHLARLETDPV